MTTKPKSLSQSLGVLPRQPRRRTQLDASAALELSVLGAAACRLTSLDRLVETVWCLTGGGWRPPAEVVLGTLEDAVQKGNIHAAESWVRPIPFFYTTTPRGAVEFRRLMRLPLPERDDPISRASAAIKFGLLDLAEADEIAPVTEDLRRFYLSCHDDLEKRLQGLVSDRRCLRLVLADRITWIETRLAALDLFARPA